MAQLAIKGHKTRGKEVIEMLEMLGGHNIHYMNASDKRNYYYNSTDNAEILSDSIKAKRRNNDDIYTLEEFLEKFPYKVGDKAKLDGWPCIITEMSWGYDDVVYSVKGVDFSKRVCSKDLQPYKEEIMEEKLERIKIDIPDGYEFFGIDDDNKIVLTKKQPQYQKTIEECAKLLSTLPHTRNGVSGYSSHALWKVQQLLICRDAYWKIAGDWKYDVNKTENYFYIVNKYGRIVKEHYMNFNHILAFPTAEMRDAFYENFKDLIEECKQFL